MKFAGKQRLFIGALVTTIGIMVAAHYDLLIVRMLLGFIGLAACIALYFLPAIYAKKRNHPNAEAILTLNLLLGWTVIGWAVAATWASTKQARN